MTASDENGLTLGLAQLEIQPAAPEVNRNRAKEAIENAVQQGANLVVLPELFTVGYFAFEVYPRFAESLDGPTVTMLRKAATEHDVAILGGSFVEDLGASTENGIDTPASKGYANTAVFITPDGTREHVYRKHHLFGYDSRESDLLTPGEHLSAVGYGGFTIGVTTCYDLRFPELYRDLLDMGATLLLVPSAWPYPRVEHWQLLPRVRAIENLCYVAAANGVATFESDELIGRSAVYDPWGTPRASLGDEPGLLIASVDPGEVERRRESFPALADRR